jgi:hypothetical protein
MKKAGILFSSLLGVLCSILFIQGRTVQSSTSLSGLKADTARVNYYGTAKVALDNKCYGCHNQTSRSEKARRRLNLDSLSLLSKVSQLSKLDKIVETIDKGEMPPQKYLERKPEGKLTAEETKVIKDWAVKTSEVLLK